MGRRTLVAAVSLVCLCSGCKKAAGPAAAPTNSYTQAAVQAGGTLNPDGSVTNANGSITEPNGTVIPAGQTNTAATAAPQPVASGAAPSPAPRPAPKPAPAPMPAAAPAATASAPVGASANPAVAAPVEVTAPSGTAVTIRTGRELSATQDGVGTRFEGTLERPVVSHGVTVFERGTPVQGEVVGSKRKGEFKGAGDLAVVVTAIGRRTVRTTEYVQVDKGRGKRTGAMIGGGGGLGAIIGGLAGGGKGALIGGLAGAGAGTAASTTGSKNVVIRPESVITVRLTEAVTR